MIPNFRKHRDPVQGSQPCPRPPHLCLCAVRGQGLRQLVNVVPGAAHGHVAVGAPGVRGAVPAGAQHTPGRRELGVSCAQRRPSVWPHCPWPHSSFPLRPRGLNRRKPPRKKTSPRVYSSEALPVLPLCLTQDTQKQKKAMESVCRFNSSDIRTE